MERKDPRKVLNNHCAESYPACFNDAKQYRDYIWLMRQAAEPKDHGFWQSPAEPLPIENEDYRIRIETPGWDIVGDRSSGIVEIETGHTSDPPLDSSSLWDRLLTPFCRKPRRPYNISAKYYRSRYTSTSPYNDADGKPDR